MNAQLQGLYMIPVIYPGEAFSGVGGYKQNTLQNTPAHAAAFSRSNHCAASASASRAARGWYPNSRAAF